MKPNAEGRSSDEHDRLREWLHFYGDIHGDDWNPTVFEEYDPSLDHSIRPDRVAIELLFALMQTASTEGGATWLDTGWMELFKERIHEAGSIDENIARIVDPKLFDESILAERRLAGESDPKPRVCLSAIRTRGGNLSVRIDPFQQAGEGRSDLLDRPKSRAPGDFWAGRDWRQVMFLRRFDHFSEYGITHRRAGNNEIVASVAMFAVRSFRYVAAMASQHLEVTFGDVPCFDYSGPGQPLLKLVPHAVSVAWRRHASEEYDWRRRSGEADMTYGIDDMTADARSVLDAVSEIEDGDEGEIATIDLLRSSGVRATRRNLHDRIRRLQAAADEHPADGSMVQPTA